MPHIPDVIHDCDMKKPQDAQVKLPEVQGYVLNTFEAARYVHLSPAYLNIARGGKLKGPDYVRIGKSIRYRVQDLDRWLEERLVRGGRHERT